MLAGAMPAPTTPRLTSITRPGKSPCSQCIPHSPPSFPPCGFPPLLPFSAAVCAQAALGQYELLYQQYASLAISLGQEPDISFSLDPQQQLIEARAALAAAAAAGATRGSGDGAGGALAAAAAGGGGGGGKGSRSRSQAGSDVTYLLGNGGVVTARDGSDVPQLVSLPLGGDLYCCSDRLDCRAQWSAAHT